MPSVSGWALPLGTIAATVLLGGFYALGVGLGFATDARCAAI
jgi:hypothetical protein